MANAVCVVKDNKDKLVKIGQGEGETKWKGWSWKLLLISCLIYLKSYN